MNLQSKAIAILAKTHSHLSMRYIQRTNPYLNPTYYQLFGFVSRSSLPHLWIDKQVLWWVDALWMNTWKHCTNMHNSVMESDAGLLLFTLAAVSVLVKQFSVTPTLPHSFLYLTTGKCRYNLDIVPLMYQHSLYIRILFYTMECGYMCVAAEREAILQVWVNTCNILVANESKWLIFSEYFFLYCE